MKYWRALNGIENEVRKIMVEALADETVCNSEVELVLPHYESLIKSLKEAKNAHKFLGNHNAKTHNRN